MFIATPHRGSPIASWGISDFGISEDVLFLRETNKLNKQVSLIFDTVYSSRFR